MRLLGVIPSSTGGTMESRIQKHSCPVRFARGLKGPMPPPHSSTISGPDLFSLLSETSYHALCSSNGELICVPLRGTVN